MQSQSMVYLLPFDVPCLQVQQWLGDTDRTWTWHFQSSGQQV